MIEAAICQSLARSEMGKQPIILSGQKHFLDVFRLPINILAFNIRNGRFAAELRAREKQLGRQLDALSSDDELIIRDLLIHLDPAATKMLKEDLKELGQTDPGIITHDGFVINGNRRMAILQILHSEHPTGQFEYLEAQRLPRDVSPKDLWRIEAGIQLSRDKRLEYGPVNDLLKIREGVEAGLTFAEMAATLYGVAGPDEVKDKISRLRLIDLFLQYVGQDGEYTRVNGLVEHFINLQEFIKWLDRQQVKKDEQHEWLLRAFQLIRIRVPHVEIRKLKSLYSNVTARRHLYDAIVPTPGPVSPRELAKLEDSIRAEFDVAKEYVDLEGQLKKPELLLDRAIRALETLLEHKSELAINPKLHFAVDLILTRASELKEACSKVDDYRQDLG